MSVARALLVITVLFLAAGRPTPATAGLPATAPIVVNWPTDEIDADLNDGLCLSTPSAKCTLRAAVQQTNAAPGADIILLGAGVYLLNRTGVDDTAFAGDLDITDDLTIRGVGMHSTTIALDTIVNERVLHVLAGVVRLEALGVTGGYSQFAGAGIGNYGALTLDHTAVFSNSAFYNGGNAAGGIYNSGQLTLTNSLVEYNYAYTQGGGLANAGPALIVGSTIAHNTALAYNGGGIHNNSSLTLINTTISSNDSPDGGSGLQNDTTGTTNAYNVTITANIHNTDAGSSDPADSGLTNNSPGVVNLRNSIVARNYELVDNLKFYDDCHGTMGIYGNVYFSGLGLSPPGSDFPPCTFIVYAGNNAYVTIGGGELLPLAYNGGPTPTHDLDPGSDAYDGADAVYGCIGLAGLLTTDQRGVPRVAGVRCDAGAVEQGSYWWLFAPLVLR